MKVCFPILHPLPVIWIIKGSSKKWLKMHPSLLKIKQSSSSHIRMICQTTHSFLKQHTHVICSVPWDLDQLLAVWTSEMFVDMNKYLMCGCVSQTIRNCAHFQIHVWGGDLAKCPMQTLLFFPGPIDILAQRAEGQTSGRYRSIFPHTCHCLLFCRWEENRKCQQGGGLGT